MKILDRYVLVTFVKNYLISFMVLIGLYVVLHMMFNFDELNEVRAQSAGGIEQLVRTITVICTFYFYQSFVIFVQLSGIIPVVAASFTLLRMSRFNELTAILAAGVPLLRVAMPVILCGVVVNFLLLPIDQELLVPNMIQQITPHMEDLVNKSARSFPVKAMQDESGALLNAGKYTPAGAGASEPAHIDVFDVIERDEKTLNVTGHITADAADWDAENRQWKLTNGLRTTGLLPDEKRTAETPVDVWRPQSATPDEINIYRNTNYVELLSTQQINDLLQRPKSYGTLSLMKVKHFRWSQLLINIVILLLAVPCVLTREPGMLKTATLKCMVLTGACLASIFIARQIAGNPPPIANNYWYQQWPLVMAWAPIFLFLPLSIFLLDRTHTRGT